MINNKQMLARIPVTAFGAVIIVSTLSIILFVINHQIKYVLFTFAVLLTWIFVLLSSRSNYRLRTATSFLSANVVDYFLAGCSIIIFVYNILAYPKIDIMLPFYMIISFFLPGWVLLRLLGVADRQISTFSILPLSFCLSIGLTSIIFIVSLFSKEVTTTLLSATYAVVCLFPILKDSLGKIKLKQSLTSASTEVSYNLVEFLVLLWIIVFFAFVISSLYPNLAFVPSSDIIAHLSLTETLTETPDIYTSEYVWFHSALAAVNTLSNTPAWVLQSAIACLSIFLIFSFYVMAKAYLSDIDRRAHLVATISFFVFSGFGWLYVVQQKFSPGISINYLDILSKSYNITYFDVAAGQGWLWLWFRPLTMGFTIFFILLYLMKRNDLSSRNYIIIASFLLTTLSQVHLPEFLMFLILLFIVTLIRPAIKLRIRETAISALIALAASAILTLSYEQFNPHYQTVSFQYVPILAFLAFFVLYLLRHQKRASLRLKINSALVSSIVLFIFSILLIHWILNPDAFSRTNFRILAVPWELYPVLLGVVGATAIFGSIVVVKKYRDHPVLIFVAFLVFAIVFGRILTYVNANFTDTGYMERRIIPYAYFSCAILSSLIILKLIQWREEYKSSNRLKNVLTVSLLSLLVLGGIFSTFLSIDYQLETFQKRSLSENQSTLVDHLTGTDPYSIFLTVTDSSRNIAQFKNFGYVVDYYRYRLWPSMSPALPLNVFSSMNSSTVILLQQADFNKITSQYGNGYIASHILKVAPVTYRGPAEEILEVPRVSPPSSNSDMVLVLPENQNRIYYAYDILSLGGYNYTTALESDVSFISKAKIVVAPNDDTALKMIHYKKDYNFQFKKLLVLNLDGNGTLLDALAGVSNQERIKGGYPSTVWSFVGNNTRIYSEFPNNINQKGDGATTLDLGEPFIASATYEGYGIFYLNAKPIIQELDARNADIQQLLPSLSMLLESADAKFPAYKMTRNSQSLVLGGVTVFQNATFTGDIVLNSSSAIVNVDSPSLMIKIDGKSSDFKYVSEIIPIDTDKTIIKSHGGIINGGEGFYSHALLNQSSIVVAGHPSVLLLVFNNGSSNTITGNNIQINLGESDVLIRQPRVESNGMTIFEGFYGYGDTGKRVRVLGDYLTIDGKVSYDIRYSDYFTVVHNSSFEGKISTPSQIYSFDELGSLENIFTTQSMPYILTIGLALILGNVLIFNRRRLESRKLLPESTTN